MLLFLAPIGSCYELVLTAVDRAETVSYKKKTGSEVASAHHILGDCSIDLVNSDSRFSIITTGNNSFSFFIIPTYITFFRYTIVGGF